MSSLETRQFSYTFPSISSDAGGKSVLAWEDGVQPFHSELELDANPGVSMIRWSVGALSADECRRVIALGDSRPQVSGELEVHREKYRDSHVAWIEPHADTHWLYHKIGALFNEVNAECGFELLGLIEPLQYATYGASQHFDWHIDLGSGGACVRKLSMTVQLSDGSAYEGGDLEFLEGIDPGPRRSIGTVTIFPSFLAHRVSAVKSGTRRSLVAWACGPSFR
jgi:PKHD-type hydroxylase